MRDKPPWKRLALTLENYRKTRDGEKTQARRLGGLKEINKAPDRHSLKADITHTNGHRAVVFLGPSGLSLEVKPKYQPGEIIGLTCPHWRCAAHGVTPLCIWDEVTRTVRYEDGKRPIRDVAGVENPPWKHRAARLMPAWACMDFARITDVRAQRLQDITELDAVAEGCPAISCDDDMSEVLQWFVDLWDSIYAERGDGWDADRWVWAYTFENVEEP